MMRVTEEYTLNSAGGLNVMTKVMKEESFNRRGLNVIINGGVYLEL